MRIAALALLASFGCTRHAPAWTPVGQEVGVEVAEVVGEAPSVLMARVRLASSQTFRFDAGACQEVTLLVEEGLARVDLTWLERGDAARFRTPAVVQAMSDDGATLFLIATTDVEDPITPPDFGHAPEPSSCVARDDAQQTSAAP